MWTSFKQRVVTDFARLDSRAVALVGGFAYSRVLSAVADPLALFETGNLPFDFFTSFAVSLASAVGVGVGLMLAYSSVKRLLSDS